jgi:endonuclease-3 related protein
MKRQVTLRAIYRRLFRHYGPQHWWPGDTPFEVMVGALLTQNTSWSNVERAIGNLAAADSLDARTIARMTPARLARLLRPAGYFNVKTRRLQNFCRWYLQHGGYDALRALDTETLRRALLSVNGVGLETADDMALYAFRRPVFVIDAYTRRIFSRLGLDNGKEGYEALRRMFERRLPGDVQLFNEYHALIVRLGKDVCRKRPRCGECCLAPVCPSAVNGAA